MSGLAPQAAQLAGRVGDGYLLAMPDGDLVRAFRAAGAGHKPVQAGMEVNWDADRDVAAEVAHRPVGHVRAAVGDQRQASAARPTRPYRGQETSLTPSRWYRLARSPRPSSRAGPDRHAARVEAYADAGVDEAYVQQIGPDMAVFVAAREKDVLPRNPVVLVISIDVSPRAMARRRHPHTEPRQTHNVGGLKPQFPGI